MVPIRDNLAQRHGKATMFMLKGIVGRLPRLASMPSASKRTSSQATAASQACMNAWTALDAAGLIRRPVKGVWPGLKWYADSDKGNVPQSLIMKPLGFTNFNKGNEYVGYPMQKRIELLEIFIKSSSNEGDVVLDPFCGCATTCIAAEKVNRAWVRIDISPKANVLVDYRLGRDLGLFGLDTTYRTDIPHRTDVGKLQPYRTHKRTLFGKQEGRCDGCRTIFPFRNFTVDHIIPKSKGGRDRPSRQFTTSLRRLQQLKRCSEPARDACRLACRRNHSVTNKALLMTKPKNKDSDSAPSKRKRGRPETRRVKIDDTPLNVARALWGERSTKFPEKGGKND